MHTHPQQCFYTDLLGCGSWRPKTLHTLVLRTTIFIKLTLASVCSTGGLLQMVKISKRCVRKLKSYEH